MSHPARRAGSASGDPIVFVACFGDNGSMFEPLASTALGRRYSLVLPDLPGFGEATPVAGELSLEVCAELIDQVIRQDEARIVIGHSLGSIVASLAASQPASPIETIISIEGNLTPEDAYFSGSAAKYDDPESFRSAFLARLADMAVDNRTMARYRSEVAKADPKSLWELGCASHRFSTSRVPGEVLALSARQVHYMYNPDNTPKVTLEWLRKNPIPRTLLPGASHWKMVDQPDLLADKILAVLAEPEPMLAGGSK